jgi:hypothetical protein
MPTKTTTPNNGRPGIGHNQPPLSTPEQLKAELDERHARLASRVMALADALDRLPAQVEDAAVAGQLSDFIGQCRAAAKKIGEAHQQEKEAYLRGGQAVDKYFRGLRQMVEQVVATTTGLLQPFMDAQREAERRRLEEAEAQRVAELRVKLEAEAAEQKAAQEAAARAEAERAKEAARVAEAAARELDDAIKASTEGEVRGDVAWLDAARAQALEAARVAEEARLGAELAAEIAAAPPAPVEVERQPIDARVSIPGADGRVLAKAVWTWEYIDPGAVDLTKVRGFLDPDAVARALDAAVKAGLRDCRGVRIFETTKVIV